MPLLDTENSQEQSFKKTSNTPSKPRFEFQSAEPLKSIPQLSTNRSAKYVRSITDSERGQAFADIYYKEHPEKQGNILEKASRSQERFVALHTPEIHAAIDTVLGGGIVNMVRGIATGGEKPKPTGNHAVDLMNYAHDNAMRGLFEPETTDVTSVALMKQYPNMHWAVAGALGTVTEFGSAVIANPISAFSKGSEFLSKNSQDKLLFNKITQSSQWGDNIMSAANKAGVPWEAAHKEAQTHLWDAINKGNYFQVLRKNMELYKPFQLKGLTVEDVGGVSPFKHPDFKGTEEAIIHGEKIKNNPEAIESLKSRMQETDKKLEEFKKIENKTDAQDQEGYDLSVKLQLYKESLRRAEGKEDASQRSISERIISKNKKKIGEEVIPTHPVNQEEVTMIMGLFKKGEITEERFQKGEITKEQYREMAITEEQLNFVIKNKLTIGRPNEPKTQAAEVVPYELPEPITPKRFVTARIDYLENQGNAIDSQMRTLENQKKMMEKQGLPTARVDNQLNKLGKQWQLIDSQIAEHIIGQNKLDDIKNEVIRTTVDSIMKHESTAEEKGLSEGIRKGVSIGKEKGRIQEAQRQSALRTFAKYKELAKEEVKKLTSQIENLNTNLLPLEYKKIVDGLKSKFDLNTRTDKTLWERGQTKKYLEEATARGEQVNIPEEMLEMLEKIPLNNLTVQQVRDLHEDIMRLYGQGRLKDKLKVANEERNLTEAVNQGKDIITRGEALTPESQIVKMVKERDAGLKDMTFKSLKYYISQWRRPEAMINQLDGGDAQGLNTKLIWDSINNADNIEQTLKESSDKQIAEMFGFQKEEEYHKIFDIDGNKLAKSDLMTIYASSGNIENRVHVLAMGFSDDIFEKVEGILSEEEKLAVKKYWQMQNDRFPEINKKCYEIEGRELSQVEKRFPILNLADKSPDEEMELEYEYRKMLSQRNPTMAKNFLKERTGSELPLRDLNFFGTIYRDIDRQNHYLAFIDPIRNANKYLKHPDIKQAIVQKHGEDTYKILTQWLKDASIGKIPSQMGWPSAFSKFVRTRSAPSYLGINFLTMAKQLIGIFPGMEMAGKSATVAFMPKFFSNPTKYIKLATEKSAMMKFRAMRQEREFEELRWSRDAFSRMKLKGYDKFLQLSLSPTLFTDRMISTSIWNAVYERLGHLPEEARIKEADRVVRRTQPMGGLIHLPHIFRDPSEIAKNMTWLKGHTNKFFNLQMDMIENKANGRDNNAKLASQMLFYTLLPMVTLFYLNHKRLPKAWEWLHGLGEQAFIGVWGIEEAFKLMGEHHYSASSTPLESYLKQVYDVFTAKKPSTKISKAVNLAATSTGFPITGVRRIFQGKPFGKSDEDREHKNKKSSKSLNAKQQNKFIDDFDKTFGYKRKRKNTGITE